MFAFDIERLEDTISELQLKTNQLRDALVIVSRNSGKCSNCCADSAMDELCDWGCELARLLDEPRSD